MNNGCTEVEEASPGSASILTLPLNQSRWKSGCVSSPSHQLSLETGFIAALLITNGRHLCKCSPGPTSQMTVMPSSRTNTDVKLLGSRGGDLPSYPDPPSQSSRMSSMDVGQTRSNNDNY